MHVLSVVVMAAGLGVVIWVVRRGGGAGAALALPGVAVACVLAWRLLSRDGRWPLAAASGLLLAGLGILYVRIGQPVKAGHEEIRPVAAGVAAALRPGETAVVYRGEIQPWVFYLWDRTIEVAEREDLPRPLPGPLVMRKAQWEKEMEKLEKRCGRLTEVVPVANPWDPERPLVVVRYAAE